ncbi:MAG: hypothetical protein Q9211_005985 [Gyalolechia sp. 1 TL-2023]
MYETRYSDGGYSAVVVASVLVLLQFLMVGGRYFSRRVQKVKLEADDFALLLATGYISWMALYGVSVALSKAAILLLYLRVFTKSDRKFTIEVCVIGFIVGATGITTTVGSIFSCTPIARNWDKNLMGKCINKLDFARYTAIPNVITGLAMLVLPLPMVWRLNIMIQQKVALTATFLHGVM